LRLVSLSSTRRMTSRKSRVARIMPRLKVLIKSLLKIFLLLAQTIKICWKDRSRWSRSYREITRFGLTIIKLEPSMSFIECLLSVTSTRVLSSEMWPWSFIRRKTSSWSP
jgi:hypothetical protein